ncbi:hypothetical protein PAMP_012157 [Pampus punctatissimus]
MHAFAANSTFLPRSPKQLYIFFSPSLIVRTRPTPSSSPLLIPLPPSPCSSTNSSTVLPGDPSLPSTEAMAPNTNETHAPRGHCLGECKDQWGGQEGEGREQN